MTDPSTVPPHDPVIVLAEPQLGENIGMAARAMGNFGLARLRLVKPRDGWPSVPAQRAAAGADHILSGVQLYDRLPDAIADCTLVFATTARAHDQAKPVVGPDQAVAEAIAHTRAGGQVAILFGRERTGLENDEVALAHRIITFPVVPQFASLNLAQAVLLMGYEWFRQVTSGALPFSGVARSPPATQAQISAFLDNLVTELDKVEFLRPVEKRDVMLINLRNIFMRMSPSKQDIQTLNGVITSIAEGRKGPASGGVLDSAQAAQLRAVIAEGFADDEGSDGNAVRGLAKLLRRNPTDAERMLWKGLTKDRRFAGQFRRQTPVGRHIPDFVSFPRRVVIELVGDGETDGVRGAREARREWLEERGYRVIEVGAVRIVENVTGVLDELAAAFD